MPSRRSAWASNMTPPSELIRPPSKSAVIFLRQTAGKQNGRRLSSGMAVGGGDQLAQRVGSPTEDQPRLKIYHDFPAPKPPPSSEVCGQNTLHLPLSNHPLD